MLDFYVFLSGHIEYFPLAALICLLLAGCNIPISEDLIIITGAVLSAEEPSLLLPNLAAIFIGVIASDFLVYWIGTRVRKGTAKSGYFSALIPEKAIEKMHDKLDRYGIFTFIVCRFIPFGVRNTLFFTSGFFNLRLRVFALYDVIAAVISVNTLFFLAYFLGDAVKKPLKIAGIVLFALLVSGVVMLFVRIIVLWKRKNSDVAEHGMK
jgi:membrane protein DedA with SNARE-associated domain